MVFNSVSSTPQPALTEAKKLAGWQNDHIYKILIAAAILCCSKFYNTQKGFRT